MWQPFREALPQETELVVLDLPGHGARPVASDYSHRAMAEDVAARTADHPPFPLVGWSVGAPVAWLFAAAHPERVTRLVLIDPAAPHQSRFLNGPTPEPAHPYTFASPGELVGMMRNIDPTFSEADVERGYRVNAAGRLEPRFDPAIFPALVEDGRQNGEAILAALGSVRAPVLVLRGERSFLTDDQANEVMTMIGDGRLETVPGAGHFMIRERPREIAGLVLDFLA